MGYYLEDHPNPHGVAQYRLPRRAATSGTVGVHTVECTVDMDGVDSGAENSANFIANRADYGSYHVLVDSDSEIVMARDEAETWHIAESDAFGYGMNSHAWGISAACRTTDWNPDEQWTQRTLWRMGRLIAEFWIRNGHGGLVDNPRWLSRDEAKRRVPGLVLHGVVQPSDRSDAWKNHPQRARLEQMLTDAIKAHGTKPKEWDEMASKAEIEQVVRSVVQQELTKIWQQLAPRGEKPYLRDVVEQTLNEVRR